MMSAEKMREDFEAAYIEGLVARCGEGFRSTAVYSLTERRPDGEYLHYPDFIAWWAWQASRAAIEVELPLVLMPVEVDHHSDLPLMQAGAVIASIESLGLKVKP